MNKLTFGFIALVALAACGGSVVEGTGAGSTGSGAGTTGSGASTTGSGASTTTTPTTGTGTGGGTTTWAGPCPPSQPSTGSSCAGVPDQLRCTYGDSVRPDCRAPSVCSNGLWTSNEVVCGSPPPSVCGNAEPPMGTTCPDMGDECVYGNSFCTCSCPGDIFCNNPLSWQCSDPPVTPDCPAVVPNDGTPCAVEGVNCIYGDVCTPAGAMVQCTGGLWKWNTMIACGG